MAFHGWLAQRYRSMRPSFSIWFAPMLTVLGLYPSSMLFMGEQFIKIASSFACWRKNDLLFRTDNNFHRRCFGTDNVQMSSAPPEPHRDSLLVHHPRQHYCITSISCFCITIMLRIMDRHIIVIQKPRVFLRGVAGKNLVLIVRNVAALR